MRLILLFLLIAAADGSQNHCNCTNAILNASCILEMIQYNESVDCDNVSINGNLDLNKSISIVKSPIIIRDSYINGTLDFGNKHFENLIDFKNTTFIKCSTFASSFFEGPADFGQSKFSKEANFSNSNFSIGATFEDSQFYETANFVGSKFAGTANFMNSHFHNNSCFGNSEFDEAIYGGSVFKGLADFGQSNFSKEATFSNSNFSIGATFEHSQFYDISYFVGSKFAGTANFMNSHFHYNSYFGNSEFNEAIYSNSVFEKNASFFQSKFKGDAIFLNAEFDNTLDLRLTGYDKLYIDWNKITTLSYDNESGDASYQLLIENFKKLGFMDDADNCYYQFRVDQFLKGNSGDKFISPFNFGAWIFYGFSKKPLYPILWSIFFIILFGILWWESKDSRRDFAIVLWIPLFFVLFWHFYLEKDLSPQLLSHPLILLLILSMFYMACFVIFWRFARLNKSEGAIDERLATQNDPRSVSEALVFSATVFLSGTKLFVDPPAIPIQQNVSSSFVKVVFVIERSLGAFFSILFFLAIGATVARL